MAISGTYTYHNAFSLSISCLDRFNHRLSLSGASLVITNEGVFYQGRIYSINTLEKMNFTGRGMVILGWNEKGSPVKKECLEGLAGEKSILPIEDRILGSNNNLYKPLIFLFHHAKSKNKFGISEY